MKEGHLTHEEIEDFLDDDPEARKRLLLHHLSVCPECFATAGYLLDLFKTGELEDLSVTAIELAKSRRGAPALWDELRRYPFDRQRAIVADISRFKSWGLAELLCRMSEEEAARNPKRSGEIAELAVAVALALRELEPAEKHWLHLLRAYAYAHLANAYRAQGDLRGADEAFVIACSWWTPAYADVGDVLGYAARFLAFRASLRRDERRFDEALECIEQALEADAPPELRMRILISKAKLYADRGDFELAVEALKEAEAHVPAGEHDPRVRLCLAQNRLDYLSKLGRFVEAELALSDVEAVARDLGTPLDTLRLQWIAARIARGLGKTEEAIANLAVLHERLVAEGLCYDAALLALELAVIFAETHEAAETKQWVAAALPTLAALSVEREALAAVSLLSGALEEERLTGALLAQALGVFNRSIERSVEAGEHGSED